MSSTVTGVSIAVFRGDDVLLVERGREPWMGFWSLPGGRQGFGETLEAAARRELLEETGLHAEELWLAEMFEPMARGPDGQVARHFVLAVYVCTAFNGLPAAGDDAAALRWQPLDDLGALAMTPGTAEVILRLAAARP